MRQTTSIGWKFLQLRPTSYVSTYTSATSASYHDASYQISQDVGNEEASGYVHSTPPPIVSDRSIPIMSTFEEKELARETGNLERVDLFIELGKLFPID
ncbi:hypothetical protein T4D_7473 [Trichinella pseudospiralis]|uniref:Uncharacterized protein n=1 Tax=Trichinella pseudospiralis TaxID=6337 RepID=A0A0V1FT02_TRIPS|nr:hypothetical protein T4D_7473 [Trichinella pseudospiralis]